MRFKTQRPSSSIPTIELIPMLNVMMGVLAFFVMTSMMLANPQGVDVQLPSNDDNAAQQGEMPDPLVVQLNPQGQIVLSNQPLGKEQLFGQMKTYLAQNPKGAVLLQADSKLPYEQVIQLLGEMRDVGGDRVSLAIEQ
ncbi:MAG: biopolymer transporter ExbD [Coleofasciculus sp. S288]|nr:biopolymer transporter ExbD [Coleofasciculus sp. S288]